MIKNITDTSIEIPKETEVIDVCKAVEEMINESEERGELRMLVKQVRKGRVTVEEAAEDAEAPEHHAAAGRQQADGVWNCGGGEG